MPKCEKERNGRLIYLPLWEKKWSLFLLFVHFLSQQTFEDMVLKLFFPIFPLRAPVSHSILHAHIHTPITTLAIPSPAKSFDDI